MLIDVKYTIDCYLDLKKTNLQDSAVKPVIFTTQKMKLSVKGFLINVSKSAVLCGFHIY